MNEALIRNLTISEKLDYGIIDQTVFNEIIQFCIDTPPKQLSAFIDETYIECIDYWEKESELDEANDTIDELRQRVIELEQELSKFNTVAEANRQVLAKSTELKPSDFSMRDETQHG